MIVLKEARGTNLYLTEKKRKEEEGEFCCADRYCHSVVMTVTAILLC